MNERIILLEHPDKGRRYMRLDYLDDDERTAKCYLCENLDTPVEEGEFISSITEAVDYESFIPYFYDDAAALGYTPVWNKDVFRNAAARGIEIASYMDDAMSVLPGCGLNDARILTAFYYDADGEKKWNEAEPAVEATVRRVDTTHYKIIMHLTSEENARYGIFETTPDTAADDIAEKLNDMAEAFKEMHLLPSYIDILGD